jgi:hypothetical protein
VSYLQLSLVGQPHHYLQVRLPYNSLFINALEAQRMAFQTFQPLLSTVFVSLTCLNSVSLLRVTFID